VLPVNLSVLYPRREHVDPWQAIGAAFLVLALTTGALVVRKRLPCVLAGWLWFLGMLVPVIGFVRVGMQSVADRFLYLPAVGIYIAVVYACAGLLRNASVLARRAAAVTGCTVSVLLALATHRQAAYWQTSETLFRHAIAVDIRCYPMLNNLATLLMEHGRAGEAGDMLKAAVALAPSDDWISLGNLGVWLLGKGRTGEARQAFERALVFNRDFT